MSDFEIRIEGDAAPMSSNIYYKGVCVTVDQRMAPFSGEAEKMLPVLERVVHLVHLKDSFRPGDRCRLKGVNLVSPDNGEVWVTMGAEGTVVKLTWNGDGMDCVLNVEVNFDSGKHKQMHRPYVHSLSSTHLERI